MNFEEIEPTEESVRRYLSENSTISGEAYGMIALLFEGDDDGFEIVHRLCEELGVKVTGPAYR